MRLPHTHTAIGTLEYNEGAATSTGTLTKTARAEEELSHWNSNGMAQGQTVLRVLKAELSHSTDGPSYQDTGTVSTGQTPGIGKTTTR